MVGNRDEVSREETEEDAQMESSEMGVLGRLPLQRQRSRDIPTSTKPKRDVEPTQSKNQVSWPLEASFAYQ